MKKRILVFLLTVLMLISFIPASVLAVEPDDAEEVTELPNLSVTKVNPLYSHILTEDDLLKGEFGGISLFAEPVYHKTASKAGLELREYMKERVEYISIGYYFPKDAYTNQGFGEILDDMFDVGFAHTGVPTEGDYLMWQYGGYSASAEYVRTEGDYYVSMINITITYYADYYQEEMVNSSVDSLLSQINPTGTDYQKIKTIYDWICANVTYDYANLNDKTYMLKHSCYAAIVDRTAVCQGYALLFYRLALEVGVDARIIVGDGGGPHAWNIVKIGNLYYNLDSTWDAGMYSYNYFLKSESTFTGHVRDAEYTTSSFNKEYPMSAVDYSDNTVVDGDFQYQIIGSEATLLKYGGTSTSAVVPASVNGLPVTSISASAFENSTKLKKVTLPKSIASIGTDAFAGCSALTSVYYRGTKDEKAYISIYSGNDYLEDAKWYYGDTQVEITTQPKSVTVGSGAKATVKVVAEGEGLTYKWYFKNKGDSKFSLTTAFTGNTYSVSMSSSRNGRQVYCIVSDKYGNSVKTNTATLTMGSNVQITSQPKSVTVANGKKATVTVSATGDGLTYKWYFKNPGDSKFSYTSSFTGSSYSVTMSSSRDGRQVYCIVSDKYGNSIKTNTVTLKMK